MEDYRAKAKAKYYAQKAKDTVKNKTSGLLSSRESTFPATVHQERELDKKHQVQSTSLYETKKRSINPGYCCQSSSSSSSSTTTTTTVDLHHIVGCNHPRSMVCLDCTGILDEDMRIKLSTKPIQEAYKLLSSIFVKTTPSDARKLSQREAKIFEAEGRSISTRMLTYGEVTFWSFAHILMRVKSLNPHAKHFCDLGSGTGKAVLIASIAIGFQRCTGVEIVKSLHNVAEERLRELAQRISSFSSSSSSSSLQESSLFLERMKSVKFVNEDMFSTKSLSSPSTPSSSSSSTTTTTTT